MQPHCTLPTHPTLPYASQTKPTSPFPTPIYTYIPKPIYAYLLVPILPYSNLSHPTFLWGQEFGVRWNGVCRNGVSESFRKTMIYPTIYWGRLLIPMILVNQNYHLHNITCFELEWNFQEINLWVISGSSRWNYRYFQDLQEIQELQC